MKIAELFEALGKDLTDKLDRKANGADEVELNGKKYVRRGPKDSVSEPGPWRLVKEAIAAPFEKFKKGQRVRVKKTGKEVTVLAQNNIGLVQTATDDATKVDPKQKVVAARGYQEYMPKELELCEASRYQKFYVVLDILEKGKRKTVSVIKAKGFDSRKEAEDALKNDKKLSDLQKERCEIVSGANWNDKQLGESSMDNPRNPALPDHFEIKHADQVVHVNISPFSWMYPDRPKMGFSLSLEKSPANIGREFIEIDKAYNDMKKADVVKLANEWLKKNGIEKLEKAKAAWAKHRSEGEKLTKKMDDRAASDDSAAKKKGMKFKIKAVVEPKTGDDFVITWYAEKKPNAAEIKKVLVSKKSETFNNYKITEL